MLKNVVITAFCALACVACTSLDSSDLRTNGMQPDMVARSNNQSANTTLSVAIHVGDSLVDFVDLEGPDVLTVQVDGDETLELKESNLLGVTSYAVDIATKVPGTALVVALARGPEDDPAPASNITFTEQLALTAPTAGQAFSRADDDLVVTWTSDPSEDGVRVDVSGECIQSLSRAIQAGDLTVTFEAGSVLKKEDPNEDDDQVVADDCDINVSVVRTRTGTLDPAFGGGSVRHEFSASAGATSNP